MLHNKDSHGEVAMKREKREKKKEINKSHDKKGRHEGRGKKERTNSKSFRLVQLMFCLECL